MWTTPVKRLVGFTDIIKRVNELNFGREMLVVIGGGVLQYETFVECANKGISTILVDNDENCYCFGVCNHFIKASTREPFKINLKLKEFLSTHVGSKIIGVYTQGCDVELTVSQLAGQFNLPGIKQKSAFFCNNKIEFRNLMAASYIDQPEYGYTDNLEESRVIARQLGFPCVFKSVDNCASRGLTIVSDCESVEPAFKTALRNSVDQRVLIDRFIEGKEYSVDTIIYKGKVYPAGISDREFSKSEGHAIQTGSLTPSLLPTDKQEKIYEIMARCASIIGLDNTAFKGDIIIDKNGKVIPLEVTARLSGGFDAQYRKPLSFGVNLISATIDMAIGRPLNFQDIIPKWVKYSKTFHILPKPGVIKDIIGLDDRGHIKDCPGIRKVIITKNIGDTVEYNHCADRVAHIIAYADTLDELKQVEHRARKTLRIITE